MRNLWNNIKRKFCRHEFTIIEHYRPYAIIQLPLWGNRLDAVTIQCNKCGFYYTKKFDCDVRQNCRRPASFRKGCSV